MASRADAALHERVSRGCSAGSYIGTVVAHHKSQVFSDPIFNAGEDSWPYHSLRDNAHLTLYLIEPEGLGEGALQVKVEPLSQLDTDIGVLVDVVNVDDQVEV